MKRQDVSVLALGASALLLLVLNAEVAEAHNWWDWHWHTGSDIRVWVGSLRSGESNAALNDWDSHCDVSFPRQSTHTELSVFAGNYGDTGWGGLASIEDYSFDWWHKWNWSKIQHCHARLNTFYSWSFAGAQGVQCQEIGHCMGFTHSNDGCMGKGYFNNLNTTVSHNWSDCNARY